MPKIKQIEKFKHPNSRKTKSIAKQILKEKTREKKKLCTNIKTNLQGEKFLWFRDNCCLEWKECTASHLENLIEKYLSRFDEELEQIKLKHSIGNRKNRQHASREDIIKMTLTRELEDFQSCGIELPNLLDPAQFKKLREWNGELRFLQNFKLKKFNKTFFEEARKKANLVQPKIKSNVTSIMETS
ncbi:unnamed protein product [Phyllotreta striolata]|uniref:Translation machinery-associated protein 16 homolog n=1 Tax=Phyllotreta striolata TaxID=444603 RepID=A0A9N9XTB0_PHYSR|nr:unnamed protein product [Phyllotreta striolata]